MPLTARLFALVLIMLAAGCTAPSGGPGIAAWPGRMLDAATDTDRRARIEIAVKTRFPGILDEISAGSGPALTAAFDAAEVPVADRPARTIQLQSNLGLYNANPAALINALAVYGS